MQLTSSFLRSLARGRVSALALSFALATACDEGGGDQDGDIYDHDPNPLPSVDGIDVSVNPAEFPTYRFSDIAKPYEDSAGCKAHAVAKGDTSELTACICDKCVENMQECDVLAGCGEIRACSIKTGCDDEYSCYLLPTAPKECVDVIDRWGNASVAVTVSLDVLGCSKRSKCQ